MAAEKKGQTIVIKKIYQVQGGHGGAWKVALADFMTAMMAFFLVMWLLGQSEETKKAVSDYFSTPSIIEYNFQNYGAQITLEKLFLDLVNEPLKAFQSFLEPIDKTPNLLDMGSQKVVAAYVADQLGDIAKNVQFSPDGFEFVIVDTELFAKGTATPSEKFVETMNKVKKITTGLADSTVEIESRLFVQSVPGSDSTVAKSIAAQRVDLISAGVEASLENKSVKVSSQFRVEEKRDFVEGQSQRPPGFIYLRFRQNELKSDGTPYRKLDRVFGKSDDNMDVYNNFVKKLSDRKRAAAEEQ